MLYSLIRLTLWAGFLSPFPPDKIHQRISIVPVKVSYDDINRTSSAWLTQ